jgi:hypothetical protein
MAIRTATTTREIERKEWPDFFDAFSRRHEGWLVTLEVLDEELGAQIEVENKALKGIVVERKGDPRVIDIFVWNQPDEDSSHIIDRPTRVWVEETGEGADAAIEIESEDHATTLLTLRTPTLPENVDGVGPSR